MTAPRLEQLRNVDADSDAKASAMAAAALRRATWSTPAGKLVMQLHAGVQLFDVLSLTDDETGLTDEKRRVIAHGWEYSRDPAKPPRLDNVLTLGRM